ncbi:MAG: AAA family ATPase, partial [Campylobacterota bacterium]|nr:AAA family ATPase [Campylobacterota bacterium]
MELVYLWVEEYKNIKEQGFNFSPRFKCDYNPDTKELTIDENENYVNIFPDNINITAIVGENGSGKSRILEFIRLFLSKDKNIMKKYKGFLLFKNNNNSYCAYTTEQKPKNDSIKYLNYTAENIESINYLHSTLFATFDYSLSFNDLDDVYKKGLQKSLFLLFPEKKGGKIDLHAITRENILNITKNYKFLKENDKLDIFQDFFQPIKLRIVFDYSQFDLTNLNEVTVKEADIKTAINKIKEKFQATNYQQGLIEYQKLLEILGQITSYEQAYGDSTIRLAPIGLADFKADKQFYKELNHVKSNSDSMLEWDLNTEDLEFTEKFLSNFNDPYAKIHLIEKNERELGHLSFGEQQL